MKKIISLFALIFLIASCTKETGNPNIANEDLIKQIEIGKTNMSDVQKLLGKGNVIFQKGIGGTTSNSINYSYRKVKFNPIFSIPLIGAILYPLSSIPEEDLHYNLSVMFDLQGKVSYVLYSI